MTERTIDAHQWRELCDAIRTGLCSDPSPAADVLNAIRAYQQHRLDDIYVRQCRDRGYPPDRASDLLLAWLAGLSPEEAAATRGATDREVLRLLIALRGWTIPPARPHRPKRRNRPGNSA